MSVAVGLILVAVGSGFAWLAVHRIRDPDDKKKSEPRTWLGRVEQWQWQPLVGRGFGYRRQAIFNELLVAVVGIVLGIAVLISAL